MQRPEARRSTALVSILLLGALAASMACGHGPGLRAIHHDVPVDPEHPAFLSETHFTSAGSRMNAIVYVPPGAGPFPVALVLHGFPGNERNLDLAQAMRRAGWVTVFFHYRGAWGSEGVLTFGGVLDDVAAVVAAVRTTDFQKLHRADPQRLALVGHSMGGFAALVSGGELDSVDCVASLAGANLGAWSSALQDADARGTVAQTLDGWAGPLRTSGGQALVAEVLDDATRFDTRTHAPVLGTKPLLLVAGSRDQVTPLALHHEPLVVALQASGAASLQTRVFDTDHAFSSHRLAMSVTVIDWLGSSCR